MRGSHERRFDDRSRRSDRAQALVVAMIALVRRTRRNRRCGRDGGGPAREAGARRRQREEARRVTAPQIAGRPQRSCRRSRRRRPGRASTGRQLDLDEDGPFALLGRRARGRSRRPATPARRRSEAATANPVGTAFSVDNWHQRRTGQVGRSTCSKATGTAASHRRTGPGDLPQVGGGARRPPARTPSSAGGRFVSRSRRARVPPRRPSAAT